MTAITFDLDVLRYPCCAGWMQLIAPSVRDGPLPPAAVPGARAEQWAQSYVTG